MATISHSSRTERVNVLTLELTDAEMDVLDTVLARGIQSLIGKPFTRLQIDSTTFIRDIRQTIVEADPEVEQEAKESDLDAPE